MTDITQLMHDINNWAESKGWNDDGRTFGDCMMLAVTELAEAMEDFREHGDPGLIYYELIDPATGKTRMYSSMEVTEFSYGGHGMGVASNSVVSSTEEVLATPRGVGVEIADCIIRLLHTCAIYRIPIERLIREKMKYNQHRPYRHGDKRL